MRSTSAALQHRTVEEPLAANVPIARRQPIAEACAYEIVTTRDAFDALATEWDELFARAGHGAQLFQTFAWNWHWCNHYLSAEGTALAVLTVRRSGRLVAVWPLVTERATGLVQLTWMGTPVSQYGDVLIDDLPDALVVLREAWAHVIAAIKPDLVSLTRVRDDAAIAPLLDELGALATKRLEAPYLDLTSAPDFDTYMQRHSSRSRKKRRAAARKIAALGDVKFARHAQDNEASVLAVHAIDTKRSQLIERGVISPALADPRMRAFFADASLGQPHPAGVIVSALQIDNQPAAVDVLIGCKDSIATHIFAFDPKYTKDRVGAHLLELTIAQSFEGGYRTFGLLAPADAYNLQ